MPDPLLRTTIVEGHSRLAFYLHKCHEFFEESNNAVVRKRYGGRWRRLVQGWGVEQGKRVEDLIGIGGMMGGILMYTLWGMIRQSYMQ